MKVGIIGIGFIGSELAQFIDKSKDFELIGVSDIDSSKATGLIKKLKNNRPKLMSIAELIKKSDLIIESATKNAVWEILKNKNLDKRNKGLLIMSTGGLIGHLNLLAKIKKCSIYLPSGAICGLDSIKSVSGKIKSLALTTTKSHASLESAPYIIRNKINLKNIEKKKTIFKGNLKNAVKGFPQNINVAATLFLASKFKNIKIKIVADPNTKYNTHEVKAAGSFGVINSTTKNLPSKNPRTSYLALLSAINVLKSIRGNLKIGN